MTTDLVELTVISLVSTAGFVALTAAIAAEMWGGRALSAPWRRMLGITHDHVHVGAGRVIAIAIALAILTAMEVSMVLRLSDVLRAGLRAELLPLLVHLAAALGWSAYVLRGRPRKTHHDSQGQVRPPRA